MTRTKRSFYESFPRLIETANVHPNRIVKFAERYKHLLTLEEGTLRDKVLENCRVVCARGGAHTIYILAVAQAYAVLGRKEPIEKMVIELLRSKYLEDARFALAILENRFGEQTSFSEYRTIGVDSHFFHLMREGSLYRPYNR
ncbi:MAG: hypothetical protein Q7S22_03425 [Candidatus Micrarchaeota archaeon]|nr:hypothetical protein [Candidatus Micrarchaeota archaeon]